jgi:hypothetical protein
MRAHSPIEDAAPDLGFASFYYRRKSPRQRPQRESPECPGARIITSNYSGRSLVGAHEDRRKAIRPYGTIDKRPQMSA